MNRLINQLKVFKSIKFPFYLMIVLGLGSILGLSYLLYLGMDFYRWCHTIARYMFYIVAVFSFVGFFFLQQAKLNDLHDVVETTKHTYHYECFKTVLILIGAWQLILFVIVMTNAFLQVESSYMMSFAMNFFLYNCFLPQCIFLLLIYLLSMIESERLGFIILTIFMILCSPMFETIQWMTPPTIPIDKVLAFVLTLFGFFYQNGDMAPDTLYGLQMETGRLVIMICFIIGLMMLILYMINKKKLVLSLVVITVIGTMFYTTLPRSTYRSTMDYKNSGLSDLYEYGFFDEGLDDYKDYTDVDYKITQYNLNVSIKDQLYVNGSLRFESTKEINHIDLTLYRGYKVNNINNDNIKSYSQDKDYIRIDLKKPTRFITIDIEYVGYHPKLYSNACAVNLSGNFPWYPMCGEKQVFVRYSQGYGMNVYNHISKAHFYLNVDAPYPIETNLIKDGNGYQGVSDSLTLIGGYIKEVNNSSIKNILPLEGYDFKNKEDYIKSLEKQYDAIKQTLKETYGINQDLENKPIILTSKDLSRNYTNNGVMIFDDYILCNLFTLYNCSNFLEYYLTQYTKAPIFQQLIIFSATDRGDNAIYENIKNDILWNIETCEEVLDQEDKENEKELKLYKEIDSVITSKEVIKRIAPMIQKGYTDQQIINELKKVSL